MASTDTSLEAGRPPGRFRRAAVRLFARLAFVAVGVMAGWLLVVSLDQPDARAAQDPVPSSPATGVSGASAQRVAQVNVPRGASAGPRPTAALTRVEHVIATTRRVDGVVVTRAARMVAPARGLDRSVGKVARSLPPGLVLLDAGGRQKAAPPATVRPALLPVWPVTGLGSGASGSARAAFPAGTAIVASATPDDGPVMARSVTGTPVRGDGMRERSPHALAFGHAVRDAAGEHCAPPECSEPMSPVRHDPVAPAHPRGALAQADLGTGWAASTPPDAPLMPRSFAGVSAGYLASLIGLVNPRIPLVVPD
ncbi:hypothetical protein [Actinomadura kijaniata]|uniref:hypothetical protein n=1 Tax=Actinomadura kijaniata TaxID=46161 RepID=UPI000A6A0542|nr:hypothetical protein [Actinomadura kijaniata]